jgi:hypothetical protein
MEGPHPPVGLVEADEAVRADTAEEDVRITHLYERPTQSDRLTAGEARPQAAC